LNRGLVLSGFAPIRLTYIELDEWRRRQHGVGSLTLHH
jgi:hypothetical protein